MHIKLMTVSRFVFLSKHRIKIGILAHSVNTVLFSLDHLHLCFPIEENVVALWQMLYIFCVWRRWKETAGTHAY